MPPDGPSLLDQWLPTITPEQLVLLLALGVVVFGALLLWQRSRRLTQQAVLLRRMAELEGLRSAGQAIVEAELDVKALVNLIAAEADKVIDTSTFQIGLFERNLYQIYFWRVRGERRPTPVTFDISYDHGLIGWVRQHRQPLYIADFANERDALPAQPVYVSHDPPRSALFIPLLSGEEVIGIVAAQHHEPYVFSRTDLERLTILTNQAAAAIANARLIDNARTYAEDLEAVSSIARQVNALQDIDAIFEQVVRFAREQLGFHPVTIMAIDALSGEAYNRVSSIPDMAAGALRIGAGPGLVGTAIATRQVVIANDVHRDDRYIPGMGGFGFDEFAADTQAEIVIPLIADDVLLGVLDVQSNKVGGFAHREQRVLEALANEVASALDKALKIEAQREQAWVTVAQFEVAKVVGNSGSLEELAETITRLTALLTGMAQVALLLWDGELELYRPQAIYGASRRGELAFHGRLLNEGEWSALDAAHVGQTLHVTRQPPPWQRTAGTLQTYLAPLVSQERPIGMLVMREQPDEQLTPDQKQRRDDLLRSITTQTAQGIEREQLRMAQQEEAWVNTALLQVAQAMNSLIDLNEILSTITRLVPMLVGVQSCIILVWDPEKNIFRAGPSYGISQMGRGLVENFGLNATEFLSLREEETDLRADVAVYSALLPRWLADVIGNPTASVVPLRARNQLVGALVVGPTADGRTLAGRRLNILIGIAQQAAIAVVNDQLYKETADKERLEQELDVALTIQASLIPDGSPEIPGVEVASHWSAARQVSGDFYDFLPLPNGNWGIIIADVAGKGIPAALFMALSRTIIRSVGFNRLEPAETLARANEIIYNDTQSDMFVTAFYAIWNPADGSITYANGGHNPPLLLRANGESEIVRGNGIALGVVDGIKYSQHELKLARNDMLVCYTDGVTEAMNANYNTFGIERLRRVLEQRRPPTPAAAIEAVRVALRDHADDQPQSDDVTMVIIKRMA